MFITELILRTRAKATMFEKRVGGMASFDKAVKEDTTFELPYCFIIPVEENAAAASGNSAAQMMKQTYVFVVVLDNSAEPEDGRGYSARTSLARARRELLDSLLRWEPYTWSVPAPKVQPGFEDLLPNSRADWMRYEGHSLIKMTDSRAWYQFEFSVSFYDAAASQGEFDRHQSTVTLVDGAAVVVNQDIATSESAYIIRVSTEAGVRLSETMYTFVPGTGVLTLTAAGKAALGDTPPALLVSYEVSTPKYWSIVKQVYSEYYPTLLDLAGGNPANITAEMYTLASEVPPDALIEWEPVSEHALSHEPETFFSGTPKVKS